jgi:hypothetical protein
MGGNATGGSGGASGATAAGGSGGASGSGGAITGGTAGTGGATGGGGSGGSGATDGGSTPGADAKSDADTSGLVLPIDRGGGKYVLEFGTTYFEVVKAGGRITAYSLGGTNILTPKGASGPTSTYFGSTLWASPEYSFVIPAPDQLDVTDYTVSVVGATITMTSAVAPALKISLIKKFTVDVPKGAIVIEYGVKNEDTVAHSWAPWEVTRVASGGLAFFPILGTPYAATQLPYKTTTGYVWFDSTPNPAGNFKIFADGNKSYIAHTDGQYLFVKSWADVPKAQQAPNEGEVEIYDGDTYVELEAQGPYTNLAPGQTASFTVRWQLRAMPSGAARAVGDAALVAAAEALLK